MVWVSWPPDRDPELTAHIANPFSSAHWPVATQYRSHRQLQALLLGRGERRLRELNGVGFGVAPTARP
jgi:hypothetical protein